MYIVSLAEAEEAVTIAAEDATLAASDGWRRPSLVPLGGIVFASSLPRDTVSTECKQWES